MRNGIVRPYVPSMVGVFDIFPMSIRWLYVVGVGRNPNDSFE